jgi:uncharacterized protein YjlB
VQVVPLAQTDSVPNNSLPLVVIRSAIQADPDDPAEAFERRFREHGWTGAWRNGIYPYHHYHSTAHEVLGIARGAARVRFGGEGGRELEVGAGDVVVIPAGVAHQLIEERDDLLVVGAYAGGRRWDILRPRAETLEASVSRIAAVPLPERDPVAGEDGPLMRLWQDAGRA